MDDGASQLSSCSLLIRGCYFGIRRNTLTLFALEVMYVLISEALLGKVYLCLSRSIF
jgi:hypothetical protein